MLCNTFTHGVLAFVPRRSRCDTLTCMLSGKGDLKNDLKYLMESLGSCGSNFTVDEGKEWLDPSRDKNQGTHRRRKVD